MHRYSRGWTDFTFCSSVMQYCSWLPSGLQNINFQFKKKINWLCLTFVKGILSIKQISKLKVAQDWEQSDISGKEMWDYHLLLLHCFALLARRAALCQQCGGWIHISVSPVLVFLVWDWEVWERKKTTSGSFVQGKKRTGKKVLVLHSLVMFFLVHSST